MGLAAGEHIGPYGQRFLLLQTTSAGDAALLNITMVQNWFAEFTDKQKR
jgi:hypothetical protein